MVFDQNSSVHIVSEGNLSKTDKGWTDRQTKILSSIGTLKLPIVKFVLFLDPIAHFMIMPEQCPVRARPPSQGEAPWPPYQQRERRMV